MSERSLARDDEWRQRQAELDAQAGLDRAQATAAQEGYRSPTRLAAPDQHAQAVGRETVALSSARFCCRRAMQEAARLTAAERT